MAAGVEVATEPAGAAALEVLEEHFGFGFQAETAAGRQVVEGGVFLGGVVGVVVVQGFFDLAHKFAAEGDAACKVCQQGLCFGGEEAGVGDQQAAVLLLPFLAVWQGVRVLQVCLEVGGFVEEYPKEEVGVEVAVDADFVEVVIGLWPAIVAQLGGAFSRDMEVYLVQVEVVIDHIHRLQGQVILQDAPVSLLGGHQSKRGQSQSLRLWRYM